MNAYLALCIAAAALLLGGLTPALSPAQERLPEEMSALVKAYSVGNLNVEHLQAACRWASAPKATDPSMTQVRTQNVAFCDGFLAATVEFARLDVSALQTSAPARAGNVLSCRSLPSGPARAQLMVSPDLRRMQSTPASEFLLSTLFACTR
jgi:hypothetical protein